MASGPGAPPPDNRIALFTSPLLTRHLAEEVQSRPFIALPSPPIMNSSSSHRPSLSASIGRRANVLAQCLPSSPAILFGSVCTFPSSSATAFSVTVVPGTSRRSFLRMCCFFLSLNCSSSESGLSVLRIREPISSVTSALASSRMWALSLSIPPEALRFTSLRFTSSAR